MNKKWDTAILEEIHDIHIKLTDQADLFSSLSTASDGTIVHPQMMWARLNHVESELIQLSESFRELKETFIEMGEEARQIRQSLIRNAGWGKYNPRKEVTIVVAGIFILILSFLFARF